MPPIVKKRCACYVRKSVEDGLEQEFNSLDAQREACENYIASQKGNGWICLPQRYDDGGFSGGNTKRPALQQLLDDCEAGLVDIIVVYKIDRLSRSICDFADLTKKFDEWGVQFVAVTQEINTATSAGRMMLNILITFAQYEREVITERVRDKMAATRKKGKFVGGLVPMGYDVRDKKLVVNFAEAEVIRKIFQRYVEIQSPKLIAMELNEQNIKTKQGKKWDTAHVNRAGIARTFQNIRLFQDVTVEDNVKIAMDSQMKYSMASGIFRLPSYWKEEKAAHEKAMELLSIFHMEDTVHMKAGSLPYGAQRRLEIVRALATNPSLLLLDEPAAGMNPSETAELMHQIRRIRDHYQIAIFLIEHDMNLVMNVCEGIVVVNYGKIIAKGTPEEIKNNPAVIEAYLGRS